MTIRWGFAKLKYRMKFSAPFGKRLAFSVKRLVLCFILVASCYLLVAVFPSFAQVSPSGGQTQNYQQAGGQQNPYGTPDNNPDVPKNLHTYTQNVMIETLAAASCQLSGIDPVNPSQKCLGFDSKTGKIGFVENGGGAIGLMGNAITMLYTPPFHTGTYFQNLASNFGLVKTAHAQITGTGFQGLLPIIKLWEVFRNAVYLIFVLVFVIIGIAIMLRVHIDPRTVMTIQNQIPKIIVGIIVVTFSFAISGFLIDIMYASIYLLGNTIVSADPALEKSSVVLKTAGASVPFSAADEVFKTNAFVTDKVEKVPGSGLLMLTARPSNTVADFATKLFRPITNFMFPVQQIAEEAKSADCAGSFVSGLLCKGKNFAIGAVTNQFSPLNPLFAITAPIAGLAEGSGFVFDLASNIPGPVGNIFGAASNAADFFKDPLKAISSILAYLLGRVIGALAFLIIGIAILWALFRIWFMLIKAYIFILLDVVYAPFWILGSLMPGSKLTIDLWLRDLLSHLAVFPAVISMFLLGRFFMDSFATAGRDAFVPPMVGGVGNPEMLSALIGLGIILLTPQVGAMMRGVFKAPEFDLSTIRQALGVGASVAGAPITVTGGIVSSGLKFHGGQQAANWILGRFRNRRGQANP